MKFSANWITELVPGLAVEPRELGTLITTKTAECEGTEAYAPFLEQVRLVRVVDVKAIEGSKNVYATIDAGPLGMKNVVCGAPNCRAGILAAWVMPGAELSGGKKIGKAKVSGHESEGMLAAGDEIGVNREHDGILEFSEGTPGERLAGIVPDHVIEIDNKSLTHRPDLWGHHGMAREVAAITGMALRDPVPQVSWDGAPVLKVEIEDTELCPRYSALVFENVTIGPSPLWLQYRLEAIGLNPISNIVDVTNFVMAELAQPTHAFDADLLKGETIYVRRARAGERVRALNDEEYALDEQALVIADAGGAEAIAGVIGGRPTGIHEGTKRVVLESANFQAASIRKTSSRLKLRTDASMRFEKAQDPRNTVRALARCWELFQVVSPGIRMVGGLIDNCAPMKDAPVIRLELDWLNRKIGRVVERGEVVRILRSLEFGVEEAGAGVLTVTVPSWRATKDVSIAEDLVEEIGRMIGYSSIPPQPPLVPAAPPAASPEREFQYALRLQVAAQGFTEVYNYSFLSEERAARFGFAEAEHVHVLNPIASDQGLMRVSLIPRIVQNIEDNARHMGEFRLFEIGNEVHKDGAGAAGGARAASGDGASDGLPRQIPHLAAAVFSKEGDGQAGLFELKRLAEVVAPGVEVERADEARGFEHPKRVWRLRWQGEVVGRLFELHPSQCEAGRGAVLDMDVEALYRLKPAGARHKALRRFPVSEFDLSVLTPLREEVGVVRSLIVRQGGEQVLGVEFVRQYTGAPLAEDEKSVSFRVTVGAADHTLAAEEITAVREGMIEAVKAAGYQLRM
ncbi:MAG: phenylalanine--tRNA ligase subunit beta [Acidobacteria bacterium]|nr:phenylalanine--tRNA ligase subunit beta [Acidobacteriota bacterium]